MLRMGDGPAANLPAGLDAYAGYADNSGIGVTFPDIVARFPAARHLSISVHGQAPAMCGDVEQGALGSWAGYRYGYGNVSTVGDLIARDGRPPKLWVAHYTDTPHICTSASCWPSSPVAWQADGTQWTTHGNIWDESLLADDFFDTPPPPAPPPPAAAGQEPAMFSYCTAPDGIRKDAVWVNPDGTVSHGWSATGDLAHLTTENLGGQAAAVCAHGWDKPGNYTTVVHGTDNHPYMRVSNGTAWLIGWTQLPYLLHPPAAGTPGPPGPAYNDTVLKAWVGVLSAKITQAAKALSG